MCMMPSFVGLSGGFELVVCCCWDCLVVFFSVGWVLGVFDLFTWGSCLHYFVSAGVFVSELV